MRTPLLFVTALLLAAPFATGGDDGRAKTVPVPRLLGPRTGEARAKANRRNGGDDASEKAVVAGLDWLARHQERSGTWDGDGFPRRCKGPACAGIGKGHHGEPVPFPYDDALTGLAVLAFLGHGHVPGVEDDPWSAVVERGLKALGGARSAWGRAIATECFGEVAAMTGDARWVEAAEDGARDLLALRQKDGAWGYVAPMRKGSDVPFTTFVVQALVACRDAGVELPDDLGPRVDAWLGTLEERKGKLAYLADGRAYGYTPTSHNAHLAVAIRELLETGTDGARHRKHVALCLGQKPRWKMEVREVDVPGRGKLRVPFGNLNLRQWWAGTVGLFQRGGSDWRGWFAAARKELVSHRVDAADVCARGSWDPEGLYEEKVGGRVLATVFAVLTLEQPYRHRRLDD